MKLPLAKSSGIGALNLTVAGLILTMVMTLHVFQFCLGKAISCERKQGAAASCPEPGYMPNASTDHKKADGVYLLVSQHGDTCTVDASVAKYTHDMYTWRSGHYFCEPLVPGCNMTGVRVLPEEYRKIGLLWNGL